MAGFLYFKIGTLGGWGEVVVHGPMHSRMFTSVPDALQ